MDLHNIQKGSGMISSTIFRNVHQKKVDDICKVCVAFHPGPSKEVFEISKIKPDNI